jgi:hypothetical protein
MKYIPKVNDYVTWKDYVKGWVYFAEKEYITIEMMVRPKDEKDYVHSSIHRNERLLVVCYKEQWNELKYIKSRQSIDDES